MNRLTVGIGLGLLSLLVVVAIMLTVSAHYSIPIARKGMEAQQQAADISGQDFLATVKFDVVSTGGREWVEVTRVDPGGPAAMYYGLMVKDRVIQFGDRNVEAIGAGVAASMIVDAYRSPTQKWPITVIRNGQTLVLPLATGSGTGGGAPVPAPPGGGQGGSGDPMAPLRGKIPTH